MNRLQMKSAGVWAAGILFLSVVLFATKLKTNIALQWDKNTSVFQILKELGDSIPSHRIEYDSAMVKRGREIVFDGRTTALDGSRTAIQSKSFRCTHCHNNVQEDPDWSAPSPQARLEYAAKNNLAFLPDPSLF